MSEARARHDERRVESPTSIIGTVPEAVFARDRVRWAPILAGVALTLAVQLMLFALGVAIGFASVRGGSAAEFGAITVALGIWAATSAIIALFAGGYCAARVMPIDTRAIGALNGVIVWAVTLAVIIIVPMLVLAVVGGSLGVVTLITNASRGSAFTGIELTARQVNAAASVAASTGGWFLVWALLGVGSTVLGGYFGMMANQSSRGEITYTRNA